MSAFIHRIAPGRNDKTQEALDSNEILTGWSDAQGLLNSNLDWPAFREILRTAYYPAEETNRRAGLAAGNMWRFIREMKEGDLVVVPAPSSFYVARVTGPARYLEDKVADDSAYRRSVEWLNAKQRIPRVFARAALLSRLKIQGTSAYAADLKEDIEECLTLAAGGQVPTFREDLKKSLIETACNQIRIGRMEDYRFEKLIGEVLVKLGAVNCDIVPRSQDQGVDLLATFLVAGTFEQRVGVQAKHYYRDDRPAGAEVIAQLVTGMEAEGVTLGMVVSSGTFSQEAKDSIEQVYTDKGYRIELIDGETLAGFLVELGFPRR